MRKCDVLGCVFTTESVEQYAGHRSGHVRKGELAKGLNVRKKSDGVCKICNKQFETGASMRGHMAHAHKPFEDLRKDSSRKRRLVEERGHKCEVCATTEWMGKSVPIELDHIDGNPTNNLKENLRLICPNCHAQTDTHAGKNVGRPQCAERDKRYRSYRT